MNKFSSSQDLYMTNFVYNMFKPQEMYMKNFVTAILKPQEMYMKNFSGIISKQQDSYMHGFTGKINKPQYFYMQGFVSTMKKPPDRYVNYAEKVDKMTKIEITYKRNSANKFDFTVVQNNNVIFTKTYSPKEELNQHIMGEVLVDTMQKWADREISRNPEFKWHSFEEFKEWACSSKIRGEAVKKYDDLMFKE